ncbi:DUF4230 domain-containing protein [Fenollaria massiliensis]|uniref:DUF4230 domain-containing protein n=1 Tax=Fenollaria massiliensis TaxID=938288 RepID=A0A9E7DK03_9FIRM|nr:DUF4230 domain-containing protein [Fenollaria massiliensis]UQK59368.1 DUF4230 domain-containing protein [Fenollaria massiliensis]
MTRINQRQRRLRFYRILVFLLIALIAVYFFFFRKKFIGLNKEERVDNLKASIEDIGDLVTVEYNYTDILTYKDSLTLMDMKIPFTDKSYIIKYNGYIKAGVDLSKAVVKDIKETSVELDVPVATITDSVLDEKSMVILDQKNNIFNPLDLGDYQDTLKKELNARELKAKKDGLLERAQDNADKILRKLLQGLGFKDIKINYI